MRYARLGLVAISLAALGVVLTSRASAQKSPAAEKSNMELVGWNDLQGRSAYQPLVHKQGERFIAYIGHHGAAVLNPLTGKQEDNGTSLLDVTNPKQPKYLAHIPGAVGQAEAGGAQMVRVCDGSSLPRADRSKVYLLRSFGGAVPRNLGRHESVSTQPAHRGRQRTARHAQELVGMRYRDRVPRGPGARVAHAAHDDDLRPERSGEAGVHPQLRTAGAAARRDGSRAHRPARTDFDRAARQPRVFRLRHRRQRRAADRRPQQAAERAEGADRRQPRLPAGRPDRSAGRRGRAHGVSDARDAARRSSRTRSSGPARRRPPASSTTTTAPRRCGRRPAATSSRSSASRSRTSASKTGSWCGWWTSPSSRSRSASRPGRCPKPAAISATAADASARTRPTRT